jgi:hypothetical protein
MPPDLRPGLGWNQCYKLLVACVSVKKLQKLVNVCQLKIEIKWCEISKNFPDNPHNLKYSFIKQTVSTLIKVKVKLTLEQAIKAQWGSGGIALLFL